MAPLLISQQHTEAVLREHLASLDIHVEIRIQLLDFAQDEHCIVAQVQLGEAERAKIKAR